MNFLPSVASCQLSVAFKLIWGYFSLFSSLPDEKRKIKESESDSTVVEILFFSFFGIRVFLLSLFSFSSLTLTFLVSYAVGRSVRFSSSSSSSSWISTWKKENGQQQQQPLFFSLLSLVFSFPSFSFVKNVKNKKRKEMKCNKKKLFKRKETITIKARSQ